MFKKLLNIPIENMGSSRNVALIAICGMMVGLVLSHFIASAAVILLVANAVLTPEVIKNVRAFLSNRVYLVISSFYILCILSGLWSADLSSYMDGLRIKLPILLMPFAFAGISGFNKKYHTGVLMVFILVMTSASMWALVNYMMNFAEITHAYTRAQVMPTIAQLNGISHIRYSLLVAYAAIAGLYLFKENMRVRFKWERYVYLSGAIFLIVFLHVLSVRSGLLAFYLGFFYLVIRYSLSQKKYLMGMLLLAAIFATPIIAYQTVPSFKNKVGYTKYDLERYFKEENRGNFSDSRRIISMDAGYRLGMAHPVIGVGIGDLRSEMKHVYKTHFPDLESRKWVTPHNQFIYCFAALGLFGLLWFGGSLLYPIFSNRNWTHPLFISFSIIVFSSFMVEAPLETQIGLAFHMTFLLLALSLIKAQRKADG